MGDNIREVYLQDSSWFLGRGVDFGCFGSSDVLGRDGVREVGRSIQAVSWGEGGSVRFIGWGCIIF
eukprot:snap_masked-scaffold_29-processed-gene-0.31-mRNA-1 protein AED:1.00 eAED:1.00 QI:0/0/0/0/1/1/2/0/65